MEGFGGTAEVQMLRDGDEVAELAKADVHHGLLPGPIRTGYADTPAGRARSRFITSNQDASGRRSYRSRSTA
jgi:hypothetical protein